MSAPTRIQLRRTKGWRMPENTVVVVRPSRWGNPYRVGRDGDADTCVAQYNAVLRGRHPGRWPDNDDDCLRARLLFAGGRRREIAELRGKNLACWCPLDQPCHADVLLELANEAKA